LILLKQKNSKWQLRQLGHMEICTSPQTDNHASTPPLSFLQAGCPSCHPTNSVKALKEYVRNDEINGKYANSHFPRHLIRRGVKRGSKLNNSVMCMFRKVK